MTNSKVQVLSLWTPEANIASGYDDERVVSEHDTQEDALMAVQAARREHLYRVDGRLWCVGIGVGQDRQADDVVEWADYTPREVLAWEDTDA